MENLRVFVLSALASTILLLSGCAAGGHYEWNNLDPKKSSQATLDFDTANCNMAAIEKISVPAPSCTRVDKPDCSSGDSVSQTTCLIATSGTPDQQCDYSAVNMAKENQEQYRFSCLQSKGWSRSWIADPQ